MMTLLLILEEQSWWLGVIIGIICSVYADKVKSFLNGLFASAAKYKVIVGLLIAIIIILLEK